MNPKNASTENSKAKIRPNGKQINTITEIKNSIGKFKNSLKDSPRKDQ